MKVFVRNKFDNDYTEITKYVHLPLMLNENADGTYGSVMFTARFPTTFEKFNVKEPFPSKWIIKVVYLGDNETENEFSNTYYFLSSDINSVRRRKEKVDDELVVLSGLYEHVINGDDYLSITKDYFLPNYTVTQPKTKYFDVFRKSASVRYNIGDYFIQDGNDKTLTQGTRVNLGSSNNDVITFGYDVSSERYYIELDDIDEKNFEVEFILDLLKTAPGTTVIKGLLPFLNRTIEIIVNDLTIGDPFYWINSTSKLKLNAIIEYYDNNNLIATETKELITKYSGSKLKNQNGIIIGFDSSTQKQSVLINVFKNANADRARVYFEINAPNEIMETRDGDVTRLVLATIGGFTNTNNVVTYIESIELGAVSSAYESALNIEKVSTLHDLLIKATHDYNLNRRDKITLSGELEVLLGVPAKESEWGEYNYYEFLVRLFKYVNAIPRLTIDNELTYIKRNYNARNIDIELGQERQSERIDDFYYDKVVSNAKNLVSDNDFVKEVVVSTAVDLEFSQMTDDNTGFLTSNNQYFVSNAILYAPGVEFNINGVVYNTNIDKPYYWDITSRLFEEEIYNSLPDVRSELYSYVEDGFTLSSRNNPNIYTKGNTISYKTGSNMIKNLGHQAPSLPNFEFELYTFVTMATGNITLDNPELSVIEMLIVLAYSQVPSLNDRAYNLGETNYGLAEIANMELEITYAPIVDEITTKHVSNMAERRGLNYEKKFNFNDRTVSYDENSDVLRKEMESKGNVKELYIEKYRLLSDTIPVNSIIGNNYYVTNKIVSVSRNKVEVEYVLQKNFLLYNEDTRLPVGFDIYNIPYEYVNRELLLENYLIFHTRSTQRYNIDKKGINEDFLKRTVINRGKDTDFNTIDGTIYGLVDIDYVGGIEPSKRVLMRMAKLESDFSLIFTGKFIDNYTAGTQRYEANGSMYYSQPFRYVDYRGKFSKISGLKLGWHVIDAVKRLEKDESIYDFNIFPNGNSIDNFNINLLDLDEDLLLDKDAREGISIVINNFLLSVVNDIKWYSFKGVNGIGALVEPIEFIDSLKLSDISYEPFDDEILGITLTQSNTNEYAVNVTLKNKTKNDFPHGIVLTFENGNEISLSGLIKNATWLFDNIFIFYINTTRYGYFEQFVISKELRNYFNVESILDYEFVDGIKVEKELNIPFNLESILDCEIIDGRKATQNINLYLNIDSELNYEIQELRMFDKNFGVSLGLGSDIGYTINEGNKATINFGLSLGIDSILNYDIIDYREVGKTFVIGLDLDSNIGFTTTDFVYKDKVLGLELELDSEIDYAITDLKPLTWKLKGVAPGPICETLGYNPIGTSCSVLGQTKNISGSDIGTSDRCVTIECNRE